MTVGWYLSLIQPAFSPFPLVAWLRLAAASMHFYEDFCSRTAQWLEKFLLKLLSASWGSLSAFKFQ
jgi:hypothetical protein